MLHIGGFNQCIHLCCSMHGGASAQLALTIAMVTGIHFVEAYLLNPVRAEPFIKPRLQHAGMHVRDAAGPC